MARCLILESKLSKNLWNYAVRMSAYIRNRCYCPRTGRTPYELITNLKPKLNNMHIFGTICFAYKQDKKKLDPRSEKEYFLGHCMESPAYLIYFPEQNCVKRIRCVKFTDKYGQEVVQTESEDEYYRLIVNTPEFQNENENSSEGGSQ